MINAALLINLLGTYEAVTVATSSLLGFQATPFPHSGAKATSGPLEKKGDTRCTLASHT